MGSVEERGSGREAESETQGDAEGERKQHVRCEMSRLNQ